MAQAALVYSSDFPAPSEGPVQIGQAVGKVLDNLERKVKNHDRTILRGTANLSAALALETAHDLKMREISHVYHKRCPAIPEALYEKPDDKSLFGLGICTHLATGRRPPEETRHWWGPKQIELLAARFTNGSEQGPLAIARFEEIRAAAEAWEAEDERLRVELGYVDVDQNYDGWKILRRFNKLPARSAAAIRAKLDAIRELSGSRYYGQKPLTIADEGDKNFPLTHNFNLLVDGVLADIERITAEADPLARQFFAADHGADGELLYLGQRIEAACRDRRAAFERDASDEEVDAIWKRHNWSEKLDRFFSLRPHTLAGVVEQFRIAAIQETLDDAVDERLNPAARQLLALTNADLSAVGGPKRIATVVEDQANKVFAEYLALNALSRAFRVRENEAKAQGLDIRAEARAYEKRHEADYERITNAIDALPSSSNADAVYLMRHGHWQMAIDQRLEEDQEMRLALRGLQGMLPLLSGQVRQVASDLVLNPDALISETVLWA